jgi:hypothetical protein
MSRYTVSKKGRTHGAYRRRLEARGLSKAPTMHSLAYFKNHDPFADDKPAAAE